jgi:hypothetical protein
LGEYLLQISLLQLASSGLFSTGMEKPQEDKRKLRLFLPSRLGINTEFP